MSRLQKIIQALQNWEQIAQTTFENNDVKAAILAVSKSKLYNKGETKDGQKLITDIALLRKYKRQRYAGLTVAIKKSKSQIYEYVTLKDSGTFYASFNMKSYRGGFSIFAEGKKGGSDISDNFTKSFTDEKDFYDQVLPPQPEGFAKIKQLILTTFVKNLKNEML